MRILIAYATTEGQTRRICRFAADRLVTAGHSVELLNVTDGEGLDMARFDAALLAGSVHVWKLQPDLVSFAAAQAGALAQLPTLFLQVSLAASGDDADERADLDRIARDFFERTGWTPSRWAHVAGAFRFDAYDFFKSWIMRRIARDHGIEVAPNGTTEFTDWAALGALLDDWAA